MCMKVLSACMYRPSVHGDQERVTDSLEQVFLLSRRHVLLVLYYGCRKWFSLQQHAWSCRPIW